jgi:hypothetical protein
MSNPGAAFGSSTNCVQSARIICALSRPLWTRNSETDSPSRRSRNRADRVRPVTRSREARRGRFVALRCGRGDGDRHRRRMVARTSQAPSLCPQSSRGSNRRHHDSPSWLRAARDETVREIAVRSVGPAVLCAKSLRRSGEMASNDDSTRFLGSPRDLRAYTEIDRVGSLVRCSSPCAALSRRAAGTRGRAPHVHPAHPAAARQWRAGRGSPSASARACGARAWPQRRHL